MKPVCVDLPMRLAESDLASPQTYHYDAANVNNAQISGPHKQKVTRENEYILQNVDAHVEHCREEVEALEKVAHK
jgi:hypothetical protein